MLLNHSFCLFFPSLYFFYVSVFLTCFLSFTSYSIRALIGVADRLSTADAVNLLNSTGMNLMMPALDPGASGQAWASTIQTLYSSHNQTSLGWCLSRTTVGHLATQVTPKLLRLYQLLLFTLPGTPVFNYGDEIGLEDLIGQVRRVMDGGMKKEEK